MTFGWPWWLGELALDFVSHWAFQQLWWPVVGKWHWKSSPVDSSAASLLEQPSDGDGGLGEGWFVVNAIFSCRSPGWHWAALELPLLILSGSCRKRPAVEQEQHCFKEKMPAWLMDQTTGQMPGCSDGQSGPEFQCVHSCVSRLH